jgi:hypothetical protein
MTRRGDGSNALPLPNDALDAVVFLQIPMIAGIVVITRSARSLRSLG